VIFIASGGNQKILGDASNFTIGIPITIETV
jgi:hypothetical protein